MSTVRLVTVLGRVATVALLTLFMSGQAFAEICIDMNLRLDEREPPAAIVESMKNEATAIWGPYGVVPMGGDAKSRAVCMDAGVVRCPAQSFPPARMVDETNPGQHAFGASSD